MGVQALIGVGTLAAKHSFGCRIVQRLIEHLENYDPLMYLLDEVLVDVHPLSAHIKGHFVIEKILESGLPRHKQLIARACYSTILQGEIKRYPMYIVEKAWTYCLEGDQQGLVDAICS